MANQFINSMTDLWNSSGTAYSSIKMNITNAASAGDSNTTDQTLMSKLIHMQIGSVDKFAVDKLGNIRTAGTIYGAGVVSSGASAPLANDGAALGSSSTAWSDLFLASGGVINWNAADVTITHAANSLAFAGAANGYTFDAAVSPLTNAGSALGTALVSWSNLFLGSGAAINYGNGNVVLTHSALALTVGPGDLRITTAGSTATSVVTVGGTQTLTGKTLSTPTITTPSISGPTITGSPTAVGATWVNLGAVTTADINGGTIDGTVIGATTAAAITGTTVSGTGASFSTIAATTSVTAPNATFSTKVIGGIVETSQIVQSSGTNIIIAPAAGLNTIIFRPRGPVNATGAVTIDNVGTIAAAGDITAAGDMNCKDLHSVRPAAPTTGVVYLGNSNTRYLFYDGTQYVMPTANLNVGGAVVASSMIISSTANYITLADTDQGQNRYIHHNGGQIGFLGSAGDWILYSIDNGALWSKQFGDFNTYWEARCGAHQDAAVGRVMGTIAAQGAGGVGTYLFGRSTVGNLGTTAILAGTQLHWSNAAADAPGGINVGSWRGMGWVGNGALSNTTLFLRFA